MRLGSIETSLVDWPGQVSAVMFFAGCNFRCGYCHNSTLIPRISGREYSTDEVTNILTERSREIDSVVFCGGEPTLQGFQLYAECLPIVDELGLRSKLDTNGSISNVVLKCLKGGLHKVSLDVKGPPRHDVYTMIIGGCTTTAQPLAEILKTMKLTHKYRVELEVRTTIVPSLNDTPESIEAIVDFVKDYADEYTIQGYDNTNVYNPILRRIRPPTTDELKALAEVAEPYIPKVNIRPTTL